MVNRFIVSKLVYIISFYVIVSCVHCAIYNNYRAIKRKGGLALNGSHFGYSVALQHGRPSRLIVGAPKEGIDRIGSVYVCPTSYQDGSTDKICKKLTINPKSIPNTKNLLRHDIMFGSSLDGGTDIDSEILIGASKLSEQDQQNNYVIGGVFKLSSIESGSYKKFPADVDEYITGYGLSSQYYSGFAQFGFSVYCVNKTTNVYGTPGYYQWRGDAFVSTTKEIIGVPEARTASRPRFKRATHETTNGLLKKDNPEDLSSLSGYAVTSGNFFGYTSYVVGSPTAKSSLGPMKGDVLFFNEQLKKDNIEFDVAGREMGEHFGASLVAADINGDGHDDLLVGAPNAHKKGEFNNGKVYVFISDGSRRLTHHQTLTGKIGTRFGTSMSNLGQITLDSRESIAIGGPFGDHGGVRVYVWVEDKLTLDSDIAMPEFPSFGYSLSRGIDVDDNNVADFAVGAVQSDSVAILRAKSVFYFNGTIQYSVLEADSHDNHFNVTICLRTYSNSPTSVSAETRIEYVFDDRVKYQHQITETKTLSSSPTCKIFNLELHQNVPRYDPLSVVIKLKEKECDDCPARSPTHPDEIRPKIPFKNNCKGEICVPDIKIEASVAKKLTVGEQDIHRMTVKIINKGDTAFNCEVDVITKDTVGISPLQNRKCKGTLCPFNYIRKTAQQEYSLDFSHWSSFKSRVDLVVRTKCINYAVNTFVHIELEYVAKLDVEGPQLTKQYDSVNVSTYNVESRAIFHIFNEGPSDLEHASFVITIPRYSHDDQIVYIYKPLENDNCYEVAGTFDKITDFETPNSSVEVAAAGFGKPANAENTISCDRAQVQCFSLKCDVNVLTKGKMHKIHIPIRLNITAILENYQTTFSIQSTITQIGERNVVFAELDVIDKQTLVEGVNIWIIFGSILGALVLLALIIGGLYKFGFFNRPEHELLLEAEAIEGTVEDVEMRQPAVGGVENLQNVDESKATASDSAQLETVDKVNSVYNTLS